jgi:hypothetical protein
MPEQESLVERNAELPVFPDRRPFFPGQKRGWSVRSRTPSVATNRVMAASRSAIFGVAWNLMALRIPPT